MDREQAAFVCSHVFSGERPVLLVSRAGGDWQFLCGAEHDADSCHLACAEHLFARDERLSELRDLPLDWDAERTSASAAWVRSPSAQP